MINRKILETINSEILAIVRGFVVEESVINVKNVSDKAFARDSTNIGVNTTLAPLSDIQSLIDANYKRYEDGGFPFENNFLHDGKGIIGVDVVMTIDSGNNPTSQAALSENGFVLLSLYNHFKTSELASNWKLWEVLQEIPTWFPMQSQNVYSILTLRGLYEIQ